MSNAAAARDNTFTSRTGDINALQRENGEGILWLRAATPRLPQDALNQAPRACERRSRGDIQRSSHVRPISL